MVWAYNRTPQYLTNITPYIFIDFSRQPSSVGKSILSKVRPSIFECGDDFLSDSGLQLLYLERARKAHHESKRRPEQSYARLYKTIEGCFCFLVGDHILLFAPKFKLINYVLFIRSPYLITEIKILLLI